MVWDFCGNIENEIEWLFLVVELSGSEDLVVIVDLFCKFYFDYLFDENLVIVLKILIVFVFGMDVEFVVYIFIDVEGEVQQVLIMIEWQEILNVIEVVSVFMGDVGEGIGLNLWVVLGVLIEFGMFLLVNDFYLGVFFFFVWYQVQLKCLMVDEDCLFDVGGFLFFGFLGIVIGYNQKIVWGFMNFMIDVIDFYFEWVEGDFYWCDGQLFFFVEIIEMIKVVGVDDIDFIICFIVYGFIIFGFIDDFIVIVDDLDLVFFVEDGIFVLILLGDDDIEYVVSFWWMVFDFGMVVMVIFVLLIVQDFDDFCFVVLFFDVLVQNLIYVDIEGNIGYQIFGCLLICGVGDGWMFQLGWDSSYDWIGFILFEEFLVVYNLSFGYIVIVNNVIVIDDYDYFFLCDWDYGYCVVCIVDLFECCLVVVLFIVQDMCDIQMDDEMWIGKQFVFVMVDVDVLGVGLKEVVDLLFVWDVQNIVLLFVVVYVNVLWLNFVQNLFVEWDQLFFIDGQGWLFIVVGDLLDDFVDLLWINVQFDVFGMEEMFVLLVEEVYDEFVVVQGMMMVWWNWGDLYVIILISDMFGFLGIVLIEVFFNCGFFFVGGGVFVVNVMGWQFGIFYVMIMVLLMWMVVDFVDFDVLIWNYFIGVFGYVFYEYYIDQIVDWLVGDQKFWVFFDKVVKVVIVDMFMLMLVG